MEGPLDKYRKKRDPTLTTEPFSAERSVRDSSEETWAGRFVIHQHAATRMHFDLRLQVGSTLQSFAVPRGISLDPKDKHLAIHTEDHPLEYLYFEDVIPEGNYGAGSMIVWDSGGVTFLEECGEASLIRGKLDFVLSGLKAKGRFALIATGRRKESTGLAGTKGAAAEWLLIKKRDAHSSPGVRLSDTSPRSVYSGLTVEELRNRDDLAREFSEAARELAEKYPATQPSLSSPIVPMVCATEGAPRSSPDYLYELKLDGVRIIAEKSGDDVRLSYRSGRVTTRNYADIARAVSRLVVSDVVLDGEIVTFDEAGRPNFQRLAPRIQARRQMDISRAEATVPVAYLVFDILRVGQHDLTRVPLEERKALVKRLCPEVGLCRALDHIAERGDALWDLCEKEGLEGMVAKRRTSPYLPGPQVSGHWAKIKREEDADFVVVGYTLSKSDSKSMGALGLGSFVGDRLVYRGRVGSGFSEESRRQLLATLKESKIEEGRVVDVPDDVKLTFVSPQVVVKVRSHGFTEEGHLRAAVFLGVREDLTPRDCTAAPNDDYVDAPPEALDVPMIQEVSPTNRTRSRVKVTNPNKIFFPEDGYTKGHLLDYYRAIAPFMLPHLEDRPVVLVRYPDGIHGKNFYQWRAPEGTPDWLSTYELYDEQKQEERGTTKSAFLVDSTDALLHIANLGCIPLHVLASRTHTREECDFITIDFDIADRPFKDAVVMALSLKKLLDDLEMPGFVKTSGQRGLHVLVPLGPGVVFNSAKILCELLGRVLVSQHSDIATMERRIDKRGDKLYVDTGQTGRSRTIVAPYSVRAIAGARVSTPLHWDELHLALDPSIYTILSVVERVEAYGDPMAGLLKQKPDLNHVLAELSRSLHSP